MNIELGDKVKDKVTGYMGIVLARSLYVYNAPCIAIQKQEVFNGKVEDSFWVDISPRLEIIEKGYLKEIVVPPAEHGFLLLDKVKDTITSFEGTIIGFTTWYSGCVRANVVSTKVDRDNRPIDMWIAIDQLALITPSAKQSEPTKKVGGPMNNPRCC